MSIRIQTPSNIKVTSAAVDEQEVSPGGTNNNVTTYDLSALGPRGGDPQLTVKYDTNNGETHGVVQVPLAPMPGDRNRGWQQLEGISGVLIYQLCTNDENSNTLVFLNEASPTDYMKDLDDNLGLNEIAIAGTHESCALHGMWMSQCQTCGPQEQLKAGVRWFDLRLKHRDGELHTYHGMRPEYGTLKEWTDAFDAFLKDHPTETLVFSLKQEQENDPEFANAIYNCLMQYDNGERWCWSEGVPRLGEVRGKGVLFTRYGSSYPKGQGIHPTSWPNDSPDGFTANLLNGAGKIKIHDWYGLDAPSQIGDKANKVFTLLDSTLGSVPRDELTLVYTNGSKFPGAPPQWIAKGVGAPTFGLGIGGMNPRLANYILNKIKDGKKIKAGIMVDYYQYTGSGENGLPALINASNFA